MEFRRIDVDGIRVSLAEAGAGQRPLLLLHGFTGAKEDFTDWLDPLAEAGWHAVAPDLRGHGSSSHPTSEDAYSLARFADDATALAAALGWDRHVLLGHSMGGMVAQVAALSCSDRLDGLVLMDTCPGPVEGLDPAQVEAAAAFVRQHGIDALADALAGRSGPLETPAHRRLVEERPDYASFNERKLRTSSPAMYAAMAVALVHQADRLPALAELPASLATLVLVGDQDRPFTGPSRRMADAIRGATLAVVPDAGHSPQFENPVAWWAELSAFLGGIPCSP